MAFECPDCDHAFNRKQQLKEHQRWHTGDLFTCDHITGDGIQCNQKFDANWKLTSHKQLHQSIHCYTCNKTYNKRTFKSHKCGMKPGPKTINKIFSPSAIENIKKAIKEQDNTSPYPLNSSQIKTILQKEADKENINVFRESQAKNHRHKNISATKAFMQSIGYNMRSNTDRRRIFTPITNRQILCRATTDDDVFPHVSSKQYDAMQKTFVISSRNQKKKKRKVARRDVDCSKAVITFKQRLQQREQLQKEKKKKNAKKKKKKKKKKKRIKVSICTLCRKEKPKKQGKRRKEDGRWYCSDCNENEKICCDVCNELKCRKQGQYDENEIFFQCYECFNGDNTITNDKQDSEASLSINGSDFGDDQDAKMDILVEEPTTHCGQQQSTKISYKLKYKCGVCGPHSPPMLQTNAAYTYIDVDNNRSPVYCNGSACPNNELYGIVYHCPEEHDYCSFCVQIDCFID